MKNKTCIVCGKSATYWEPRFNYFACKDHENIAPAYIHDYAEEYKLKGNRNETSQLSGKDCTFQESR